MHRTSAHELYRTLVKSGIDDDDKDRNDQHKDNHDKDIDNKDNHSEDDHHNKTKRNGLIFCPKLWIQLKESVE